MCQPSASSPLPCSHLFPITQPRPWNQVANPPHEFRHCDHGKLLSGQRQTSLTWPPALPLPPSHGSRSILTPSDPPPGASRSLSQRFRTTRLVSFTPDRDPPRLPPAPPHLRALPGPGTIPKPRWPLQASALSWSHYHTVTASKARPFPQPVLQRREMHINSQHVSAT